MPAPPDRDAGRGGRQPREIPLYDNPCHGALFPPRRTANPPDLVLTTQVIPCFELLNYWGDRSESGRQALRLPLYSIGRETASARLTRKPCAHCPPGTPIWQALYYTKRMPRLRASSSMGPGFRSRITFSSCPSRPWSPPGRPCGGSGRQSSPRRHR